VPPTQIFPNFWNCPKRVELIFGLQVNIIVCAPVLRWCFGYNTVPAYILCPFFFAPPLISVCLYLKSFKQGSSHSRWRLIQTGPTTADKILPRLWNRGYSAPTPHFGTPLRHFNFIVDYLATA